MNQAAYSAARSSLAPSWVEWVDGEPHVPTPRLVPFLSWWALVGSPLLLSVTSPQSTLHGGRRPLLSYDLAEGGNEMSPFHWKTRCLLSKETHATEGQGEMKHYKQRKKRKTGLFTVRRCKMKLFWQIQFSHVERPRISHLWLKDKFHPWLDKLYHPQCTEAHQTSATTLPKFILGIFLGCYCQITPFFRVSPILMYLALPILPPGAENPEVWSPCFCKYTDISMAGHRHPGKKIAGHTPVRHSLHYKWSPPAFLQVLRKLLSC